MQKRNYNYKSRSRSAGSSGGYSRGGGGGRGRRYQSGGRSKTTDYSQFVKPAAKINEESAASQFVPKHKFSDFELEAILTKNIEAIGYEFPTEIQDASIPLALGGADVIGVANTGTGKTAAFGIPVLNKVIKSDFESKALIVAPTRELAEQINQELRAFGRGSGIYAALLIGGQSMGPQLGQLRDNPSIVVGTPGRIIDHIKRGTLNLNRFDTIVLDEVDRMCDMGFLEGIKLILSKLAQNRQSLFFSATITSQIQNLISGFMSDPQVVKIVSSKTSDFVDQNIVKFNSGSHKVETLHDLLNKDEVEKTIIFSETKRGTEKLYLELVSRGFKTESIHGDKNQAARKRALKSFKENKVSILVATDVAARGIDVVDITHVINYDLPNSFEDYTHRIGRAGRAGRKGYALTFVPNPGY